MKFRTWIYDEGFGIDYDKLPDGFRSDSFDAESIVANNGRQKLVSQIADSNSIDFHPENRPQDFIKIEPVNKLTKFDPPQPLRSFEGSEILYGMKFNAKSNLLENGFSKEVEELKAQRKKLIDLKKEADRTGTEDAKQIVFRVYQDMVDKGAPLDLIQKRLPQMVQSNLKIAGLANIGNQKWDIKKIANIIRLMKRNPEERQTSGKYSKQIEELDLLLQPALQKLNAIPRMCFIIEQAFLKKIKHPQTPEDNQLCDHFVKLAVENYTSMRGKYHYDYVMYPESSSKLNTKIAEALASHYGAVPIKGFQKIADPKIDMTSYINNYPGKPDELITGDELAKSNLRKREAAEEPPQMKSGYWRIQNDLQGIIDRSKGQIKNVQKNQPFIRNLKMDPTIPQQVKQQDQRSQLRNRRLLVIDDNTRSGATFQTINHILRDQGPQSIHYYTPLLADFTYGVGNKKVDVPKRNTNAPVLLHTPTAKPTAKPTAPASDVRRKYIAPKPVKPEPSIDDIFGYAPPNSQTK